MNVGNGGEGGGVAVRATNRCVQDSFCGVPAAGVEQVFTDGLARKVWRNAEDRQRLLQPTADPAR